MFHENAHQPHPLFEALFSKLGFFGMCSLLANGDVAAERAQAARKELAELNRQIRNLAKRCKRAEGKAFERRPAKLSRTSSARRRCPASSRKCMMVYVLAGCSSPVAVDFALGRGWRRRRPCAKEGGGDAEVKNKLTSEIESAFASLPLSGLVALDLDPVAHFELCDLLCAHKYIMEHRLHEWISTLNCCQGVAPSRAQVVAELPGCISIHAPAEIRERLCRCVQGTARKQRRWLARFRKRWQIGYRMLKVQDQLPFEEKRQKARFVLLGFVKKDQFPHFFHNRFASGRIVNHLLSECVGWGGHFWGRGTVP